MPPKKKKETSQIPLTRGTGSFRGRGPCLPERRRRHVTTRDRAVTSPQEISRLCRHVGAFRPSWESTTAMCPPCFKNGAITSSSFLLFGSQGASGWLLRHLSFAGWGSDANCGHRICPAIIKSVEASADWHSCPSCQWKALKALMNPRLTAPGVFVRK